MISGVMSGCNQAVMICLTLTEVVDEDGVMMKSSKDDRSWCESFPVGDFTNCVKEVEWRSSANPLSIKSGEVPGKLKSPHIIRRSTASVPRLVRSKPNSSKNTDLLEEGGR